MWLHPSPWPMGNLCWSLDRQGEGQATGGTYQLRYRGVAEAHTFLQNRSNNIRDFPPLFPSFSDEKHLEWWPERPKQDVIAAYAEAWRHNLLFLVNNVPVSDGQPKKVAVSVLGGFVAQLIHAIVASWPMGLRARLLKPTSLSSARFTKRFREGIKAVSLQVL